MFRVNRVDYTDLRVTAIENHADVKITRSLNDLSIKSCNNTTIKVSGLVTLERHWELNVLNGLNGLNDWSDLNTASLDAPFRGNHCYDKNVNMSILKVARLGHPVLRQVTEAVTARELQSLSVQQFIDDMIVTMKEYDGVGLAADQVHESMQIAVLEVASNPRYPNKPDVPLTVLVNPKVTPLTEEMEEDWEGCLSVPDLRGRVPRYKSIRVEAWDRSGKAIDFVANDFHARVIQHEFDHLNGKVYLDRMGDFSTLTFLTEYVRYWIR
jgi:peptide deformylase